MDIKRVGSQPSGKGPAEYFTGAVRVDPLFQADAPARAAGASVTFEPGARTAWHTHPLGQTLVVVSGCGRVQRWGGPVEEVRPARRGRGGRARAGPGGRAAAGAGAGGAVWCPPGEKRWHGASRTTAMTHI